MSSPHGIVDPPECPEESVARASHKLLTLLTTIRANLSLLRSAGSMMAREDYDDTVVAAETAAERLQSAITNLFALENFRPGKVEPVSCRQLREIAEIQIANIRLQHPLLEPRIDLAVEPTSRAFFLNPGETGMVIENLLDNALKFSDKPIPEIILGISSPPDAVAITVQDNGRGIDPDDQPGVFEPFVQCGEKCPHSPGVGLGLSLVEKIVTARGGRVHLESTPGEGTIVLVEIPDGS